MKPIHRYIVAGAAGSLLAMVAPAVALNSLGIPSIVGIASLSGIAVFVTGLLTSSRIAMVTVVAFAISTSLAVAVSGNAWLSTLLMAAAAATLGVSSHWGLNKALTMVPIALGFVITATPPAQSRLEPAWFVTALVSLVCGLWAIAVLAGIRRLLPAIPKTPPLSIGRSLLYAAVLGLMIAVATWCAVNFGLGHPGGWLILTIFIVFQPFIQDSYLKSVHRAGGTLLGFVVVFAVGSVTTSGSVLYLAGTVCVVLAMYALLLNWPYWQYATFLTATIVLFESTGVDVLALDVERLVATLAGVACSLAMTAILYPFARRLSVKRGETHF